MNYVDSKYTSDIEKSDDEFAILCDDFQQQVERTFQNDDDFIKLLQSVYIPDVYTENGSKEKLYTKLVEVLVAIWAERLGYESFVLTKKSGTEDIRFSLDNKIVVSDVKTFRLGRSQKAPNVKDFLKLESVRHWIDNCKSENQANDVIGGLITYTSSHEWSRESEVYIQCSSKETPVIMLPYEILALFLNFKDEFDPARLFELWDFDTIFPNPLPGKKNKELYWRAINSKILDILEDVSDTDFNNFIERQKDLQIELVAHYRGNIDNEIKDKVEKIEREVNAIKEEDLRAAVIAQRIESETGEFKKYIDRIIKYRPKK